MYTEFYKAKDLWDVFHLKHGGPNQLGPRPRLRSRFGYFTPDDIYETCVASLVTRQTAWLDVGCGRDVFPSNRATAKLLAERCQVLIGLDPSNNIDGNELIHERFKGCIEDFHTDRKFDLITLRMVAEHITDPEGAVRTFARLCRLGGRVVIYTVYKWSPVTIISSIVPFGFHHRFKRIIWHTEEEDTFPTVYRMNTRRQLRQMFAKIGFEEEHFSYLDDCRSLARWTFTNVLELSLWKTLHSVKLHYPEVCLLGIYRKL